MPIRERRKSSSYATSAASAWKRPPPCSRCRWRPSRETGVWLGVGCYCKSEARIALASPPNPDASYAFPGMPPAGRNRNLRRPSRSLGPRRATEVFRGDHIARQSQSADELAGAFHGRRDPGFCHVGSPIRAATVRSCERIASSRNWQANHIFPQLLRERKGAPRQSQSADELAGAFHGRRDPGFCHVGSPIRAATVRSCERIASSRNWQANHIFPQLLRERKGAPRQSQSADELAGAFHGRRDPGFCHVGSPIRAATVRSCERIASSRNWQANHIFPQLLRERKGAPKTLLPPSRYVEHESTARTALQRRSIRLDHPLRGTRYPPPRAHQERLRAWDWARTPGPRRHRQRTQARTR